MTHEIEHFRQMAQAKGYLQLLDRQYAQHPYHGLYREDVKKGLEFCLGREGQDVFLIRIQDNREPLGHAALIMDAALPGGEAFFGFFECDAKPAPFAETWAQLVQLGRDKGINKLKGPVNGSIWHAYRVPKKDPEGFPAFPSEPVASDRYHGLFKGLGPSREISYYSGARHHLDTLVRVTAPSAKESIGHGYRVHKLSRLEKQHLEAIWQLVRVTFSGNWGYLELTLDDFLALYGPGKVQQFGQSTYLVKKGDELVGFCAAIQWQEKLILKTMAIHPAHQGKGVGNALVHTIHKEAMERGIQQVIYALIREGNKIRYFPRDDARVIREYACYEFDL